MFQASLFMLLSIFLAAINPFPTEIGSPAVAQHDETFYIVGGMARTGDGIARFDTVYRYEVSDESWQLMPNRMKYDRQGATAMMVNSSIFPACD